MFSVKWLWLLLVAGFLIATQSDVLHRILQNRGLAGPHGPIQDLDGEKTSLPHLPTASSQRPYRLEEWQTKPGALITLSNRDGKQITASVGSIRDGQVALMTPEGVFKYDVAKLSAESRKVVRELDRLRNLPRPLPLPLTAVMQGLFSPPRIPCPLTVVTHPGSGHYYLKLIDQQTGNTCLTFFIRGGDSSSRMLVPAGTYELRYAVGKDWYGPERLFGEETAFYMADSDLILRDGKGDRVEIILGKADALNARRVRGWSF
jgi:hypothetical protein